MKFYGLQKMTLLDFPGRVACTIFTGGCNFRCPFCHNALLVEHPKDSDVWEDTALIDFLKTRRGLLDGVCVTGGEPLLHPDLFRFLTQVKDLGFLVKLDTNGSFPDRLREITEAGLVDYVAMDIKNSPEKYAVTAGVPGMDLSGIRQSVEYLLSGKVDFEFRTTVVAEYHEIEDLIQIAEWIRGTGKYYLQNFVDSGNLLEAGLHAVPKETLYAMQKAVSDVIPGVCVRGV